MRSLICLAAAVFAAGCNPYVMAVSAVSQTYDVATDERSVGTQASDTEIEGKIKAALVESPVSGTDSISVYSRRGVVVLLGVVPPGSGAGAAAVSIARQTSGVRRVETFFVDSRPDEANDIELEGKIKAALVEDPNVTAGQVSASVYSGTAVLVGVVASEAQREEFVADVRSVAGVQSVRSYILLE
jgi:osmotically-inducible protein OsmY